MSEKARDSKGRWRCVSVGFRVSPEESILLDKLVRLSGLTKQEYLVRRVTQKDLVVLPNPRVHKALKEEMRLLRETIENTKCKLDEDLQDRVLVVTDMYDGLGENKE